MNETGYELAIAEIERYRAKIEALKPHLDKCEEIKAMFPQMNIRVGCGYTVHTLEGALLMVNDLNDMREIVPIGRALALAGYHSKGFEDYPQLRRRTYDFGPVQLSGFLKFDGAACEFKQVGVKEAPVYELVCAGTPVDMTEISA